MVSLDNKLWLFSSHIWRSLARDTYEIHERGHYESYTGIVHLCKIRNVLFHVFHKCLSQGISIYEKKTITTCYLETPSHQFINRQKMDEISNNVIRLLYYSAFQAIDFECTGRKLFQKGFVCTKLVIYVFRITFSYLVYVFKLPLIIIKLFVNSFSTWM
jgi:hypothetical protein